VLRATGDDRVEPVRYARRLPSDRPRVQEHWNIEDLLPGVPGTQFLIPLSIPSDGQAADAIVPMLFTGNPGTAKASGNCATP